MRKQNSAEEMAAEFMQYGETVLIYCLHETLSSFTVT